MAESETVPNFGAELKDGFKSVNAWVTGGIAWLEDIQQFYRERSVIENEYSAKLKALAKKYHEKKARKIGPLSVGETPTLTPGSLESASLTTWTKQLSTLEKRASEHERYAVELTQQLAEPLRVTALRLEDLRKSHVDYANKLEKERDAAYMSLKRAKGQYDGVCQEVESKRKKVDSSFDTSKAKAQNSFQQQLQEMHNVKNTYIISINTTNKQKETYYYEYIPELLDSMQSLSESRVNFVNTVWSLASRLENQTLLRSTEYMQALSSDIERNDPKLDSMMFVRHNISNWQEPPSMGFEASPVWHDDAQIATDEASKVFLRNVLGKSKGQRNELKREVEHKRREIEKVRTLHQRIREGQDNRDELEALRTLFALQDDLHESERKWITAETETSTIIGVVGDISLGAQNHNFKSQTFKIPTNCDLCGERIWGLSAKGFDCRDCGYTCHSKCELKVPADCPGEQSKEDKKKLKAERQAAATTAPPQTSTNGGPPEGVSELADLSRANTMNSLSSGYAANAQRSVSGAGNKPAGDVNQDANSTSPPTKPSPGRKNRIVAPPPAAYISEAPGDTPMPTNTRSETLESLGKMLYPYNATGEGELTVDEGAEVSIVEADDGGGWMTVKFAGSTGVVPTAYVEPLPAAPMSHPPPERPESTYSNSSTPSQSGSAQAGAAAKKKGPVVAPKRGAKKLHMVEALYDYTAQSDAEWSMAEGDRFVLVTKDSGDGWAEVEKGGSVKSVPANYIQDV